MWLLSLLVIAKVVGCFVAEGIMTYETTIPTVITSESHFLPRDDAPNSWQNILKSAMFRTLSKYTGFSPSLDVKMEADTLLWEKLNGAKYTRKVPKHDSEGDALRTGVLIDLSRENGHLEFRQVDKSLYTLEPKDHRLLAFWRMRTITPNHYIIQVKVPEEPPIEHFYEFSQTGGLKETTLKDVDYNRSKQNKNGGWKVRQRKAYAPGIAAHTNGNSFNKRPDHYVVRSHQYTGNRYKMPQDTYRNGKAPRTYLPKPPTQYYTVVGIQTPPPIQKFNTWGDYSYQPTYTYNGKDYPEFKQESEYNGFLPSLGPASSSPGYQALAANEAIPYKQPIATNEAIPYKQQNEAVSYKETSGYYPPYTTHPSSPIITQTPNPYPLSYFKPSTEFVQYSELDPFYSTPNESSYSTTFGVINTAAAGLSLLGQYPLYYNAIPSAAISVQVPPVEAGKSLYDLAVNSLRNENNSPENEEYTEIKAQPTATSFTVNASPEGENFSKGESSSEVSKQTTTEILKTSISEISLPKTRIKNSLRNPLRTSNSGSENYEYAPLYVRWGEKIKPTEKFKSTTPEIKVTPSPQSTTTNSTTEKYLEKNENIYVTEKSTKITDSKNITETNIRNRNSTILKPSERLQELQRRRLSLFQKQRQQMQKLEENSKQESVSIPIISSPNETLSDSENGTNFIINNITAKSPEEVVRDYTTMGLQNATSAESSENLRKANAKSNAKDSKNKEIDNENEGSEPVSVVVSRISQSYSYKTSEGESGHLRQLIEKS